MVMGRSHRAFQVLYIVSNAKAGRGLYVLIWALQGRRGVPFMKCYKEFLSPPSKVYANACIYVKLSNQLMTERQGSAALFLLLLPLGSKGVHPFEKYQCHERDAAYLGVRFYSTDP